MVLLCEMPTMLVWISATVFFSLRLTSAVRSRSTVSVWSRPTLSESSTSTEVDMFRSAWMLTSSPPFLSSNMISL